MSNNHGRQAQGNTSRKMISGSSMYVHNLAGHVDIRAGSPPKSAGQHGGGSSLRSAVAWHLVAQQMPQMWAVACGEDAAACQWHDARGQLLPRECRRLAACGAPRSSRSSAASRRNRRQQQDSIASVALSPTAATILRSTSSSIGPGTRQMAGSHGSGRCTRLAHCFLLFARHMLGCHHAGQEQRAAVPPPAAAAAAAAGPASSSAFKRV